MTHPHLAPHKSMLADDLKLSSDDDDADKGPEQSAPWVVNNSLSEQHTHTHGGRVRHSSSDSSGSDSYSELEEESSGQRSLSPSPETHSEPGTPTDTQALGCTKEIYHPSTTQWQLDKWLKKVPQKSSSCDQDPSNHDHAQRATEHQSLSPDPHRAPSPSRPWGIREDYSPSQSPVPSPRFNYSPRHSPRPSPGYSPCPSPSPCSSPCPSPTPRHSPIPSPVLSVCPSPFPSPRATCSLSSIPQHPPRSPSPSLTHSSPRRYPQVRSPHQESHRPPTWPSLTTSPSHRPKIRPWTAPVPSTEPKSKPRHSPYPPPQHSSRPKSTQTQPVPTPKTTAKAAPALTTELSHRHKHRPRPSPNSSPKLHSQPCLKHAHTLDPKSQHLSTSGLRPKESSRHSHNYNSNPRPSNGPSLTTRPSLSPTPRAKTLPTTDPSRETSSRVGHCSKSSPKPHSLPNSKASSEPRAKFSPSPRPKVKSWAPAPHSKLPQRKPQSREREQEVDNRRETHAPKRKVDRQTEGKGEHEVERQTEKQGERQGKKQKERKWERQGERRLAEEQLLRRPWVQSSEEEEDVEERKRRREEREKEKCKRRWKEQQQQSGEWQAVQPKQRPHTNSERHHHPIDPQRHGTKKKRRRKSEEEEERQSQPDPSPPPSPSSPTPVVPPTDSSASSESDSEPDLPPNVTKVPADSTSSQRPIPRRGYQGPGRPADSRPRVLYPRLTTAYNPGQGHQIQGKQKLYTLVPFGRRELAAASHRGLRNLVVQIDLSLLNRVPDTTTGTPASHKHSSSSASSKQKEAMRHLCIPETDRGDSKRKRKSENGIQHHRESKRSNSQTNGPSAHTESTTHRRLDPHSDTRHNGFLEDYLDSTPLSDTLSPTKPPIKTQNPEPKMEVECCVGVSGQSQPECEPWGPPLQRAGGQRGTVTNHEPPHHAEYYMHEAKRMKHRADAMVDKLGKAVNYVDAALSFMECGKAMEEGPLEAKSPYTMYAETVELIRYAMKLKNHSGPGARQEDQQLAVLCFRCLALLYWQMFRLKKDHALKYSKALLDYFKSSPKVPTTPPIWSDSGKGTGGPPSSLSPSPSALTLGSHTGSSPSSLISIPQRIHQMAANHLNITNSVLYSYEYWEVADSLARDNKEFFNYLNTLSGPLTLHSSIAHAVQYTRQALQWIRISANVG